MSASSWLVIGALIHLASVAAAFFVLRRAAIYTTYQLVLQASFALLFPVIGIAILLVVAREAVAEPQGPDESRFDRDLGGPGHG